MKAVKEVKPLDTTLVTEGVAQPTPAVEALSAMTSRLSRVNSRRSRAGCVLAPGEAYAEGPSHILVPRYEAQRGPPQDNSPQV